MKDTIIPILLCGGSGTRLWPLSRKSFPKQFSKLMGEESLFQASVRRLSGPCFSAPVVITGDPFRFIVMEQLAAVEQGPRAVLIEPEARNTAPAVLAAALWLEGADPHALVLIAPCDHVMSDPGEFRAAVEAGVPAARAGNIVTFGVRPTRPETGYGYLELATAPGELSAVPLARFVEKPDAATAAAMVESGNFLWNAGIFLSSVATLREAYAAHCPELVEPVCNAVAEAKQDLGFVRLAPASWSIATDISIDYAVMERAKNLWVVPISAGWSDLGGWDAVWAESGPDSNGNVCSKEATAIDCRDTLLRSESSRLQLVGIGLSDIVAVAMPDAVLVAHKSQGPRVKEAVAALKQRQAAQAEVFPIEHRPWGWFESLVVGSRFQVKRIVVHPGAALSLQSHHHRSEHWIVVEGTAKVTIGDDVRTISENQSVYVPLGARFIE